MGAVDEGLWRAMTWENHGFEVGGLFPFRRESCLTLRGLAQENAALPFGPLLWMEFSKLFSDIISVMK